jgi:CheY-like chemotaxis protein
VAHRLLVVDDDDDVRGALTIMLQMEGYEVVEARDGREALQLLRAAPGAFGAILLDIFMPEMNGWSFRAEQLKDGALAAIPVLVITADSAAAEQAAKAGVVAAMTKPVEPERLMNILEQHCPAQGRMPF